MLRGFGLLQRRAILAYFVRKIDYSYLLITFKSEDRKPTRILLTSRVLTCILSRKIVIYLRSLSFEFGLVRSCIISLLGCKKYYYCFFEKLDKKKSENLSIIETPMIQNLMRTSCISLKLQPQL